MENCTRRDALKGMALGAAGIAGVGLLASCAPQSKGGEQMAATGGSDGDVTWNALYDVVVIGLGAAGASTAIAAADAGAKVLVLEAAPDGADGGNSHYCQQAFMSIDPADRERTLEYFKWLRGDYAYPTDEIIEKYVDGAIENADWFASIGGDPQPYNSRDYQGNPKEDAIPIQGFEYPEHFTDGEEPWIKLWTHTGRIAHADTWKLLKSKVVERADMVDIWHSSPATDLVRDEATGAVIGVVADVDGQTVNIRARNGVVICSGGFEANKEMMQGYCGVADCHPLGGRFNTGEGINMAARVGAKLTHMHTFGGYINSLYADGENAEWDSGSRTGKLAAGQIWVGGDGTRFTDESYASKHGHVPFHGNFVIHEICDPAWCVFDEAARTSVKFSKRYLADNCEKAIADGYVLKADTLEELASLIEVPAENLAQTVTDYNGFCETGRDYAFGRPAEYLVPIADAGPYYAFRMVHTVLNTQGGPMRNINAEIVDKDEQPIPHLYGAGEAGEIWSNLYQGPGNMTGCMIWGRTAGVNAAAPKDDAQPAEDLAIDQFTYVPKTSEPTPKNDQVIGKADGMNGDLYVAVTMDGDKIASVEVAQSQETSFIGGLATEGMPAKLTGVTASEVDDVDVVSGATVTSMAIKEAVKDALA